MAAVSIPGVAALGVPARAAGKRASNIMSGVITAVLSPGKACMDAIAAAEIRHGIPTGFLLAIGRVESGRLEPRSGVVQPWPWTIDIGGKGSFFVGRPDAIAAVTAQQADGVASIDVGCMQVNLQQHPAAFKSLEDAFDPAINADYAARFLVDLKRETGDWILASGFYHSRTEALAEPYRSMVAARYSGANPGTTLVMPLISATPVPHVPTIQEAMATAWAATLNHGDHPGTELRLWPDKRPVQQSKLQLTQR